MLLLEIFNESEEITESEFNELLNEAAVRVFKSRNKGIVRYFRCTSGPKAGKYAATPSSCSKRKDPKKVRHGKKVARAKKATRNRKTEITKRTAVSKMLKNMNKRITANKPMQHRATSNVNKPTVNPSTVKPQGSK